MPRNIEEDCLVVYEGEILDLKYPIFILRGRTVSLAYYSGAQSTAWYYDELNDSIAKKYESQIGFAGEFVNKSGLLNHSGVTLNIQEVTKEMITYKAVPISGLKHLNYIEDELTDI